MTSLTSIAKQAEKFAIDNSPTMLTAFGVAGSLVTAYFTGQATVKATILILDDESKHGVSDEFSQRWKERTRLVWKLYIPAAGSAALTITSIIAANHIGSRRAAAVAAAYSISEKAFSEYREKVVERIGPKKEQAARDELAQERMDRNPLGTREVIVVAGKDILCFDEFTARYFYSDMETLRQAQNDVNYQVQNSSYASLGDFYSRVGLSATSYSEEVGWNCDKLLELQFSTTMSEDGRPCISVGFAVAPVRDYHRLH